MKKPTPYDFDQEIARVNAEIQALLEYLQALQIAKNLQVERNLLPSRNHHATIGGEMEAPSQAKRRSGPKLGHSGPFATAAMHSRHSMFEIAAALKVPYNTLKSWNLRAAAPKRIKVKMQAAPYFVPPGAWKG